MTTESEKGEGSSGTTLDQLVNKSNLDNEKFRQADKKAHSENLKILSDKLEALHLTQLKWLDSQKTSLDILFTALKESLDPACRYLNREKFIRAKRNPGESMRSFISRCSMYIMRADEINDVAESPWANSLILEKIYANLSPWDRKILKKAAGMSEDVQLLCEKADELLALSEEVVGSLNQETMAGARINHRYYPPSGGHNSRQNQGENWWQHEWQNQRQYGWQWPNQGPANEARRGCGDKYIPPYDLHGSGPRGRRRPRPRHGRSKFSAL